MIKGHATSRQQERLERLHAVNSKQEFRCCWYCNIWIVLQAL